MPGARAKALQVVPADALDVATERLTRERLRERLRARRKRLVRAHTISIKRLTKRELEFGRRLFPEDTSAERPRTRAECNEVPRPCPFVSCKHHLFLDVSPRTGAIKLNFPDLEVWDMGQSCALDVADEGGTSLEQVGVFVNLTRERIRQVETRAFARLLAAMTPGFAEHADGERIPARAHRETDDR